MYKFVNKKNKSLRFITEAAVIGAIYAVLTIVFSPISYGLFQVRIAEALTVLPAFTPAAIPGLFIGCIISNIIGGNGPLDIIFGSLATLIAAILSYKMPKRYLVPLPPVLVNAVVVGIMLSYILKVSVLVAMGWVALGQAVACYGVGYILMMQLEKYRSKLFK
ncbi:MAG TPA: QueT transporter family protein [Clostridiales bacterium]|nr:QueT transporter family protein [Clostridiales bacterium]